MVGDCLGESLNGVARPSRTTPEEDLVKYKGATINSAYDLLRTRSNERQYNKEYTTYGVMHPLGNLFVMQLGHSRLIILLD